MKTGLALLFCLCAATAQATDLPMNTAVLRGLDKVTGRMQTFEIPVGEVGQFGKTFVIPESCFTRPPEESPENSAFLYVYEKSLKGENIELFKGWMFSSNPALSSMENPVYDIWVVACVNKENKETSVIEPPGSQTLPQQQTEPSVALPFGEAEAVVSSQNLVPATPVVEELPLSE